jgi:uncharacterized protein (DUF2237 family)
MEGMRKTCKVCGKQKLVTGFYRHGQTLDGYLNQCKECVCARVRKHRRENDHVREYDRRRAKEPDRKLAARINTIRWRESNQDKYKAQTAVGNALRDGKLKRKKECEMCGSSFSIHCHHEDYSRPLDVIWLCAKCHHRLHAS